MGKGWILSLRDRRRIYKISLLGENASGGTALRQRYLGDANGIHKFRRVTKRAGLVPLT